MPMRGMKTACLRTSFPYLRRPDFDVPIAGAHLLGKDARRIASQETVASIAFSGRSLRTAKITFPRILHVPSLKRCVAWANNYRF
jgi:hypothetical protein